MSRRLKYLKRPSQIVLAVQIALDTRGFSYKKWGTTQTCRRGDWLVDNGGDVYTVNRESFARTYRRIGPGRYLKITPVWAERAAAAGKVPTKEGVTHYRAGDYLVFNEKSGGDAYAVTATKFHKMYVRAKGSRRKIEVRK
jgi:hypothetical protein